MTHLIFKKGHIGGRQDQTQLIGVAETFEQFKALIEERENLFPQEDGSIKDEVGQTVHETGDESFDFGDYCYTWSTIDDLSPSELKACEVAGHILWELTNEEKRKVLAEALIYDNEIVHYFGDLVPSEKITDFVELFTKIDADQLERISDVLGEYDREWKDSPCDPEGPTEEQDIEMDEIVRKCAREIAAIVFPEERINVAWSCGDGGGYINLDGKPCQDGKSTSMDADSRMNFATKEDAQAFIDKFDFSDADPKFKLWIEVQ